MDRRGNSSMDHQDCSAFRRDPSPSSPAFAQNHPAPAQNHRRARLFGESERKFEDWEHVSSPVARPKSCRTLAFRQQQSSSRSSSGNSLMNRVSGFEQQQTSSRSSSGNNLSSSTRSTIDSTREVNYLLPRTPRPLNRKALSARAPRRNDLNKNRVKDVVIDSNYKSPTRRSAPLTRRSALLTRRRSAALKPLKIGDPKGSLRHGFGKPITPPPQTPRGQLFFGNDFVVPEEQQKLNDYIRKLEYELALAKEKQAEGKIKKTEPDFEVYADSESENERAVEVNDSDDDWGGAGVTGVPRRLTSNQNRVPGSPGISALWQERNPNFLPEKFRIKKQPGSIFSRPQAAVQQRPQPVMQDENITPLSDIFRTGIATREDDDVPRKPGLYLRPGGKGFPFPPRHGLMEPSQRDANRDNILANRRSSIDNRQSPSRDDRRRSTRSHGLLPRRFGH